MSDKITETPHTTVIERRGSGGGILIGIVLLDRGRGRGVSICSIAARTTTSEPTRFPARR